jgi:hypothetical protein
MRYPLDVPISPPRTFETAKSGEKLDHPIIRPKHGSTETHFLGHITAVRFSDGGSVK